MTIIECRGVTKRFGGTVALDDVSVAVEAGTVHALVGENGAGKSTLGKVFAGVHQPDAGEIYIDGERVDLRSPSAALARGITMVAQELSLVPGRSVLDNVLLGIESSRYGVLRGRDARQRVDTLAAAHGIELDPMAKVGSLSVAEQQRVEILRALARDARVIVMDEPTARLSHVEAASLIESLRTLAASGVTIVYVSHFLDEVLELADEITVLRNGAVIRTSPVAEETRSSLVEGIAGRSLDAAYPERRPVADDAPVMVRINGLSRPGEFDDVSIEVRAGEIVTLAGLVGSGRTEVGRAVFGATRPATGTIEVDGEPYRPTSPRQAIDRGIAMIPESRRSQGLLLDRRVIDNVSLPHLGRFSMANVVRAATERREVEQATTEVRLTGASIDTPMYGLSGGNQQKSLFARWLIDPPKVLIADEPTRGVDVGSKRAIYDLLVDLAAKGMAILAISSEIDEVLGISHRVVVMREGRVVGELDGASASDAELMRMAFGLEDA
ncbi:MAG: sugar ABC transporter ATP-binding protein [Actinomycetota bacterium]